MPLVFHSSRAASSSSGIFIKPLFPLPSPATRAVRNPTQIAPPKFESSPMFPFHHVPCFLALQKSTAPTETRTCHKIAGYFHEATPPYLRADVVSVSAGIG